MSYTYDRVAADEAERERQHREGLVIEARSVSVEDLAARSLREMSPSDLSDLIANTPAVEEAASHLMCAVAGLSEVSWMVFAHNLRRTLQAEQERREREYLRHFRSSAFEVLS